MASPTRTSPVLLGKTALAFAVKKRFPEIEAELRRHGAHEPVQKHFPETHFATGEQT